MRKKVCVLGLAAMAGMAFISGCGNGGVSSDVEAKENETVNIAIQPSAAFIPLYYAKEAGWIEEALKEYDVEVVWNEFESGPPLNESLAAGESDIGVIGDVPTVSSIAAGQDNQIISLTCDAPLSYSLLVPADSEVQSVAELKGKKIATVVGSTGHNLVNKLLAAADLTMNDIELINISAGDCASVLSTGQVDAVAIWEPTITRLVDDGTAKIIASGDECGLLGVNSMVARKPYAEENQEIVQAVVDQYEKAIEALGNKDEDVWSKIAEEFMLEPDQLTRIIEKFDYKTEISQEDIASLNDTIEFLVSIDTLEESYDITPYVNTAFTE